MIDRSPARIRILVFLLFLLVIANLALLSVLLWPVLHPQVMPVSAAVSQTETQQPLATLEPTLPPVFPSPVPDQAVQDALRQQGIILLSMRDGQHYHLFAYHPQYLPLTRLTNGDWDDITPAISPDGTRVAYSSHKSGSWDLYLLDLRSGDTTRLTSTPDYDGAPSWSPDGGWLAFESYSGKSLEILLLSLADLSEPPMRLTGDLAADYAPTWSPLGREVAFVSMRTGEEEIWLAKLDDPEEKRYTNLSHNAAARETAPSWSPDGRYLAWSAEENGLKTVEVWDRQKPEKALRQIGPGEQPVWDPNGRALMAREVTSNHEGFTVYDSVTGLVALPLTILPGEVHGMDWQNGAFTGESTRWIADGSRSTAEPLFQASLAKATVPAGRSKVVNLEDVQAPYPMLQDHVDESFQKLRQMVAVETGWDFLGNLENAFIPLTQVSGPGMEENWLYTGRAIATNSLLMHAGWVSVVREDINGQTYWRVFLKARFQDGSQGLPMTTRPWNLDARNNGDPQTYEQGGALDEIPQGYWIDFTELAGRYGWERLPALISWITYYPAARFNQFVMREGLDWRSAMAELYPPEAMQTPTVAPTAAISPSPMPTNRGAGIRAP